MQKKQKRVFQVTPDNLKKRMIQKSFVPDLYNEDRDKVGSLTIAYLSELILSNATLTLFDIYEYHEGSSSVNNWPSLSS